MNIMSSMQNYGAVMKSIWNGSKPETIKRPLMHIPLDHPTVFRAKALIPQVHWQNSWIAGSAASRYPLNKDVDVWVCSIPRMMSLGEVIPGHKGCIQTSEENYDHIATKMVDEDGLQIMVGYDTIQETLDRFDISCHAVAVNIETGDMLFGIGYDERVKVSSWTMPHITLRRYYRFAERYQDWSEEDELKTKLQECAAATYGLMTEEQLFQEARWLTVKKGL